LRHPAHHALFNVSSAEGVTTALKNPDADLPLQATELPGLTVLPAGPNVDVPSDLLASPAMARLVRRLATEADVVLFDAPPVTVATDAAELATVVDGVLLTVTAGVTKRDEAQRAKELLEQVGARVVGAALVNVAAEAAVREYLAA
jgi:non-specific protein-tyrosine kinase